MQAAFQIKDKSAQCYLINKVAGGNELFAGIADGQILFSNAGYGQNNAGPHALTSATTTTGVFPAEQQTIAYNSFDKAVSISEGNKQLQINYGHHRQRITQHYTQGSTTTAKLWAGACEYINQNGQQKTLTYLSGPEGVFALLVKNQNGSENIRYIHKDHLGSWNTITDENGNLLQELSFDPWGTRRNPATWRSFTGTPPTQLFDRGFTGHEHLYAFGLINMNGRIYDPLVSRMLSPDNFIQAPDFSQSFNRYSYVWNNPLVYTDPDGEWVHLVVGAVIGGTMNWMLNGGEFTWDGLKYFGVGALAGAIGAGVGAGVSAAIAGAGVTGVSGASFATGFIGTSTAISTGFYSGFVSGAAGGFSSGFISGFGNAAIKPGNKLEHMLLAGVDYALKGAVFGGVTGGIAGGIDAKLHDRNFWTGAGKQDVVFAIDEFGRSKLIDLEDFGDKPSQNLLDSYKTKISPNNSTSNSDGLFHTEIKVPKNVNGVHNYLRSNYDAGLQSFSVDKGMTHITSLNPIETVVLSGWRYHSNPLNSVKDLFHKRLFY